MVVSLSAVLDLKIAFESASLCLIQRCQQNHLLGVFAKVGRYCS